MAVEDHVSSSFETRPRVAVTSSGMEGLITAAADFLAALLQKVGFIGAPRRRKGIREDLDLLRELDGFQQFHEGTIAYQWLTERIVRQVAELSGIDLRTKRRSADMSSIVICGVIACGFGYATYWVYANASAWLALLPGIPGAFFAIATLGMATGKEEVPPEEWQAALVQPRLPIDPR